MATFVNDRYVRLQATVPRYLPVVVGVQSGTVTIYKRTSSATTPALPNATATFTYSTGALTGLTNSWTTILPPLSDGAYLWSSAVYFGSSSPTYDVTVASWSTARLIYDAATIIQAQADATSANTALAVIASDNLLSRGEKPEVILRWNTVSGEVSVLQTQADTLIVSRASFDFAYTTLLSYLTSIFPAPSWADVNVDTPIVGTTFRTNFLNYYNARAALIAALTAKANANAAAAQTSADAANTALTAIFADNVLSRDEKQDLIQRWAAIVTELPLLDAQADARAVSRTAYDAAYVALSNYLPVGWNDTSTNTVIVRADANTAWNNYYTAKTNLLTAIASFMTPSKGSAINDDPAIEYPAYWNIPAGITVQSGATATGAVGSTYFSAATYDGTDRVVFTARVHSIDPNRVYSLTANLFAGAGNNRNMYVVVQFYDAAGSALSYAASSPSWGGTYSGYTYGAPPPVNGQFSRCGSNFGPGTGRPIPANAKTCKIGVWFQYTGGGSSSVLQGAQDIRLVDVNDIPNSITLIGRGVTVAGNRLIKTGGTNGGWDADAYSAEGYQGGAYCSFTIPQTGQDCMVGLDSSPTETLSYDKLDFAIYLTGSAVHIYQSGVDLGAFLAYSAGDNFSITHDSVTCSYRKNGVAFRNQAVSAITSPLFFDCSLNGSGMVVDKVQFGPMTSNAPAAAAAAAAAAAQATADAANTALTGTFTVSGGSDLTTSLTNGGTRTITTRTASITGGASPFTYVWMDISGNGQVQLINANTATLTVKSGGFDEVRTALINLSVSDANRRTAYASFNINATFGTP